MWTTILTQVLASGGGAALAGGAKNLSEEQARLILERGRDDFGNIDIPTIMDLVGREMPQTELANIQTDPRLAASQQAALDRLQLMAESGGMTMADRAAQEDALARSGRAERQGLEGIRQNMSARGTLGGGAELGMALDNQQNSANRARQTGMTAAANAQERAFNAIMQGGQMAGRMQQADWGRKAQVANAKDVVNKYNAVGRYADMADAKAREFDMRVRRASGMNQMNPNVAQSYRNSGDNTAQTAGAVGNAINQGAGAVGTYYNNQNSQDPSAPPLVQADGYDTDWQNPYYEDPSKLRDE